MAVSHADFAKAATKDAMAVQHLCLFCTSTRLLSIQCTLTDQSKRCRHLSNIVCLCCSACLMMVDQNIVSASSTIC